MKKNDFVLPILIILLMFFVPCTIYGINRHKKEGNNYGNPNYLPKVDNTLYFYDNSKKLLGTYECEFEACNEAITKVNDKVNIHEDDKGHHIGVFYNNYVFIQDGEIIKLYDLENKRSIASLYSIKDYGVGIDGDLIILENDKHQFGLFNLAQFGYVIQANYDYMGLIGNKTLNGKVDSSKIIVSKDNNYYLIDKEEKLVSASTASPIYYYDDNFVYYKNSSDVFFITDYEANQITNDLIIDLKFFENCNVYRDNDGVIKVYSKDFKTLIYEKAYDVDTSLRFEVDKDELTIYDKNDKVFETISLKQDNENAENNDNLEQDESSNLENNQDIITD